MNIFLIGYRATGKSTVGRLLAAELKLTAVDADDEIEKRAGKSISAVFSDDGEAAFRDLETEVVGELAARDGVVASLGGGAVVREQNRRLLAGKGAVVWLKASPDALHRRIAADVATESRRPNLTVAGGLEEIRSLLQVRGPLYEQCADCTVDTEGKTPRQVTLEIVGLLKNDDRVG